MQILPPTCLPPLSSTSFSPRPRPPFDACRADRKFPHRQILARCKYRVIPELLNADITARKGNACLTDSDAPQMTYLRLVHLSRILLSLREPQFNLLAWTTHSGPRGISRGKLRKIQSSASHATDKYWRFLKVLFCTITSIWTVFLSSPLDGHTCILRAPFVRSRISMFAPFGDWPRLFSPSTRYTEKQGCMPRAGMTLV